MYRLLLLLTFLLSFSILSAQSTLQKKINDFATHPNLIHGQLSVAIMDVATNKMIAGHRPNKNMIPASSLKVLITGIALKKLGKDYRFKTELLYDGTITEEGILKGNLIIRGYGDPTLGSHHFEKVEKHDIVLNKWTDAIKKAGIKKIEGYIIGDASYFSTQVDGRTWLWEDLGNYYGAGAWGLNFHENLYHLDLKQTSKLGATPSILTVRPTVPNLHLINELTQDKRGTGDNAYIFGVPYGYTRFIRGTIPIGSGTFTIKGSVPDPPFFAAFQLMQNLEKVGISTSQRAGSLYQLEQEGIHIGNTTIINTYHSPTLQEIVKETNLKSVNLYCEALLRLLAKIEKGNSDPSLGLEIIMDYLNNNGLPTAGLFLRDASGLSPRNSVSARHLAAYLAFLKKQKDIFPDFKASLPVGGKSGALKYLFRGTIAENRVFAKSGGMDRVRSYSGYVQNKAGKWLSFSIIANNFSGKSSTMRKEMEKLMLAFCQ